MTGNTVYDVEWEGRVYRLSLRSAPDGFLTGADRVAAETIAAAYVQNGTSFLSDEDVTHRVFALLARVHDAGGAIVPAPWPSWLDIPDAVLEALQQDFFHGFLRKTNASRNSEQITALRTLLELLYAPRIGSGTRSPMPEPASATVNSSTEPEAGRT